MNLKERFTSSLDSLFLAMAMAWTVTIAVALLHPEMQTERNGVVEIHSLIPAASQSGI
jgi:hypothetical protein